MKRLSRNSLKSLLVVVFVAPLTWPAHASAAFFIDQPVAPVAEVVPPQPDFPTASDVAAVQTAAVQTGGKTTITHKGVQAKKVGPAIGMGKNIPLAVALQQILPSGWYGLPSRGDILVSWQGSPSWVESLTTMLAPLGAAVVIDWSKQTVTVNMTAQEAVAGSLAAANEPPATPIVEEAKPPEPDFPPEIKEHWKIRVEDNMVSSTLERWSDEARAKGDNWKVSWECPKDFPVMFNAQFFGTFEEAVTQLVQSLAATEAPVQAIIYDNHVVRIIPIGTKIN